MGRFISVDPVMDLTDPQQWAAYSYANNNPTTYSDPTGLIPLIDGMYGAKAASQQRTANPAPPAPKPPVSDYTDKWRMPEGETGPSAHQQVLEQVRVSAYNATASVVNGVASFGSAMWHHPADALMFVGGIGLAAAGLVDLAAIGAACLYSAGVGCVAGGGAIAVAAAAVVAGGALAVEGSQRLLGYASTENNMQIMRHEDGSAGGSAPEGLGADPAAAREVADSIADHIRGRQLAGVPRGSESSYLRRIMTDPLTRTRIVDVRTGQQIWQDGRNIVLYQPRAADGGTAFSKPSVEAARRYFEGFGG